MKEWRVQSFGETFTLGLGPARPAKSSNPLGDRVLRRLVSEAAQRRIARSNRREPLVALFEALTRESFPTWEPLSPHFVETERRVLRALRTGLQTGHLEITKVERPRTSVPLEEELFQVPESMAPKKEEEVLSTFELRVLDEIGEAIAGIEVVFSSQGKNATAKTDGQGVARFDGFEGSFGSARIKDPSSVEKAMEKKWVMGRLPLQVPNGIPSVRFSDKLPNFQLEAGVQMPVVIRPETGRLEVRLKDKSGGRIHALQKYKIEGPVSFEGETDEAGALVHAPVPAGNYSLTLTQTFDDELKLKETKLETQLIVLPESRSGFQDRWIGAIPEVRMARLRGMVFDTNKTFLLPTAIPALTKIRSYYERNNPSHLLIVGHTDTTGDSVNDKLSKDRAEAVKQFLTDDVQAWLKNYDAGVPEKQRWGNREDRLMMTQLDGFLGKPADVSPILWYQRYHNARADFKNRSKLKDDGLAGPKTREELIRDYMALDGTTLKDQKDFEISIETHGCGENFPLDATGNELDARAVAERDGERDPVDRRVELFFFDPEYKVAPAKTSPKGEEYLVWRKRSTTILDENVAGVTQKATVIEVPSAHYRTGSAVLLPEGEAPTSGTGSALSSVGMLAMALRFNEERPGRSMLLAGHADSVGSDKDNDKLSEKRAELTHAVLTGNRDKFAEIVNETGKVSDWKQIFRWASAAVPGFEDVAPATIDDNATTGKPAAEKFQKAYNANREALGISGDELKADGVVGKKTWGAIFDLYQWNMAEELGEVEEESEIEDPAKRLEGLTKLQGLVTFLPTKNPFVGFGEHFPADGIGKDNLASVANRRVEVMFFEKGNEPDVGILQEAPDVSELYQGESFERATISMKTARRLKIRIVDEWGFGIDAPVFATLEDGSVLELRPDSDGLVRIESTGSSADVSIPNKLFLGSGSYDPYRNTVFEGEDEELDEDSGASKNDRFDDDFDDVMSEMESVNFDETTSDAALPA